MLFKLVKKVIIIIIIIIIIVIVVVSVFAIRVVPLLLYNLCVACTRDR